MSHHTKTAALFLWCLLHQGKPLHGCSACICFFGLFMFYILHHALIAMMRSIVAEFRSLLGSFLVLQSFITIYFKGNYWYGFVILMWWPFVMSYHIKHLYKTKQHLLVSIATIGNHWLQTQTLLYGPRAALIRQRPQQKSWVVRMHRLL